MRAFLAEQLAEQKAERMARHLLSHLQVKTAGHGDHYDGDGLILRVKENSASWLLRYTAPSGKRREFGLGACDRSSPKAAAKSLTAAREAAEDARGLLRQARGPIDERQAERSKAKAAEAEKQAAVKGTKVTLASIGRSYHEEVIEPSRTSKHAAQWIATLEQHVFPKIGDRPIAEVTAPDLLPILADLQQRVPETCSRVRQRLEAIFEHALFHGLVANNPAASLKRKLREGKAKRERGHHAAMAYKRVPNFIAELRKAEGTSARCLEFTILTAARTGEALAAQWSEFDLDAGVWRIPGERMKAREPHAVYLSDRAVEIVKGQERQSKEYAFPNPRNEIEPLSNMSMLMLLRRLKNNDTTVHGFRASFSSWANELSIAKPDAVEAALAHRETNLVRRAYNRAQFLAERRALMVAWGNYCTGKPVVRADGSPVTDAQVLEFLTAQAA